jgi:glycosyltransferase involved in cell wall biosynthesis
MLRDMRMKVDVVMCTWNSNKAYFEKCLRSIAKEIPVHHFIDIDSFSTDGTVSVIKRYFPEAVIVTANLDLANKRRLGISHVDTPIFAFIDDDIVLSKGWLKPLMASLTDDNVGAAQGRAFPSYTIFQHVKYPTDKIVLTKSDPDLYRGETHNTLIKTDLVKDWGPPMPNAAEDILLKYHLFSKNKTWVYDRGVVVHHYIFDDKPMLRKQFAKSSWGGANHRVVGLWHSTTKRILLFVYGILLSLKLGIAGHDAYYFVYSSIAYVGYFVGYLRWNKYK